MKGKHESLPPTPINSCCFTFKGKPSIRVSPTLPIRNALKSDKSREEEKKLYSKLELKSKFYFHCPGGSGRDIGHVQQVYMEDSLIIEQPRIRLHLQGMVSMAKS